MKRRNRGAKAPATSTIRTIDGLEPTALRCRHCDKPLTAPAPIRRRLCRSCWRVHKVLVTS